MDLLPTALLVLAGGVTAKIADRVYADKAQSLGGVTVPVGALGAAAGLAVVAVAGKSSSGIWQGLTALSAGAAVVEATEIGTDQLMPMLEQQFPDLFGEDAPPGPPPEEIPPGGELPPGAAPYMVGATPWPSSRTSYLMTGLPSGGLPYSASDQEVADAFRSFQSVA